MGAEQRYRKDMNTHARLTRIEHFLGVFFNRGFFGRFRWLLVGK